MIAKKSQSDRLQLLQEELESVGRDGLKGSIEIKQKIAQFCLDALTDLVEDMDIQETCYTLTGEFAFADYGDELNEIMDMISELELPAHHVSRDVADALNECEKKLREYVTKLS